MKNKKIFFTIATFVLSLTMGLTLLMPKTKVSAYSSINGADMRPVIPFNIITFTDGTYYDTVLCPTTYIIPTGLPDTLIMQNYTSNSQNASISYEYIWITNSNDLGDTMAQGTNLRAVGKNVNNTIKNANLNFLAREFIYRTNVNNNQWNNFKVKSNIGCKYTVLGEYITPTGETNTLSFTANITANRLVNLTNNLNNNIVGDFEYVYFNYLNLYLEKTSTSYVSDITVDVLCSCNSLYSDEVSLGQGFVNDLVNYNPPPAPPETVNVFGSLIASVDAILSIEILPEISFYDILIVCVCIPLLVGILKAWLGG